MATDVQICNLALSHIGHSGGVVSIDPPDQSVQAQYCAMFYEPAVLVCLAEGQWGFASKTTELAELTNDDTRFAYMYAVPSDLLTVSMVFETDGTAPFLGTDQQDFSLINGSLYTNQANASIEYTRKITDTAQFTPLFVDAVTWLLASYLAGVLIKGDVGASASLKLRQAYVAALGRAAALDGKQRHVTTNYTPEWIRARA